MRWPTFVSLPRRMRALLATLVGFSLGLPPTIATASSPAVPLSMRAAPPTDTAPEVLYDEGKRAYRLGRFEEAVTKWEQAYDKSERSLLLYNIALAYKGRYGISGNVDDLRKARAVMKNFLIIAQADPDVDADDAADRIDEIDAMIAEALANPPDTDGPKEVTPPVDVPRPFEPEGEDPGKKLRIAGAATMGGGGLLTVTGAVLGIYFGVRGQEFSDQLRQLQVERIDVCATPGSQECADQDAAIDSARSNGRSANLRMGLAFGIAGGLGLVAVGAGAVVFVQGNRRTADWKAGTVAGSLRVVPTGRGLAVSGRF